MRIKSRLFSLVFASASASFLAAGPTFSDGTCTIRTAKQSVSTETLCACKVVDARMLRYIQRRADFEDILSRTLQTCPAFAAVLTDFPTASITNPQRTGDGPADESGGGSGGGSSSGGGSGDGGGTGGGSSSGGGSGDGGGTGGGSSSGGGSGDGGGTGDGGGSGGGSGDDGGSGGGTGDVGATGTTNDPAPNNNV